MDDRPAFSPARRADPAQMASWSETLVRRRRALAARIGVETAAPCPDTRLIQHMKLERARLDATLARLSAPDTPRCA